MFKDIITKEHIFLDKRTNKKQSIMAQYIDRSAVVAELERLYNLEYDNTSNLSCGKKIMLRNILLFLDTLEAKEVDLENCMICKVDWYDGFLLDYTQEQQDKLLEKIGANVGDKIRVILIKE